MHLIAFVFLTTLFLLGLPRGQADATRARLVLDCVVALRTGESLPAILIYADDMNAAALLWCDEFVDHGGRPEELPRLDQWD